MYVDIYINMYNFIMNWLTVTNHILVDQVIWVFLSLIPSILPIDLFLYNYLKM